MVIKEVSQATTTLEGNLETSTIIMHHVTIIGATRTSNKLGDRGAKYRNLAICLPPTRKHLYQPPTKTTSKIQERAQQAGQ